MNHFSKIQQALRERGLDGILLTCEANRFYASDFHTMADEDGLVLITLDKSFYITDSRYIEAAERTLQDAELVLRSSQGYAELVKERLAGVSRLGFEDATINYRDYLSYAEKLGVEMVPASDLLDGLRQSKDADEIASMIQAQRISEKALEELLPQIKVGMTEKEISALLQYLMLKNGSEKPSFEPIVASGPNSSLPHAVPTDRAVQPGDFLTMDFGSTYNGYCSDMTRTVAIGFATEEMRTVYDTVLAAQLAGISLAKAGIPGVDVHNAAAQVIASAGYGDYFGHGFGHSLGIEIHENPGFNPRSINATPCNAVISAEPGIYLPGRFGVRIEDVVITKEDGCENITAAPKELIVLPG